MKLGTQLKLILGGIGTLLAALAATLIGRKERSVSLMQKHAIRQTQAAFDANQTQQKETRQKIADIEAQSKALEAQAKVLEAMPNATDALHNNKQAVIDELNKRGV